MSRIKEVMEKKDLTKLLMVISEPNVTLENTLKSFKKEYKPKKARACASLSLLIEINVLSSYFLT